MLFSNIAKKSLKSFSTQHGFESNASTVYRHGNSLTVLARMQKMSFADQVRCSVGLTPKYLVDVCFPKHDGYWALSASAKNIDDQNFAPVFAALDGVAVPVDLNEASIEKCVADLFEWIDINLKDEEAIRNHFLSGAQGSCCGLQFYRHTKWMDQWASGHLDSEGWLKWCELK